MTITNGNALDAEIIQEIMSQPGSAKDKLDQMKGYVDGTYPIRYSHDEFLSSSRMPADRTDVWSSRTPRRHYHFLTAKHGERILHGMFKEDGHAGLCTFSARYDNGIIQESFDYYPSGNIRTHNVFDPVTGLLTHEYSYPDQQGSFAKQQYCTSRTTGIGNDGEGVTITLRHDELADNSTMTYWESYIPTLDGLRHGPAKFYYPTGELRATEEYYHGQEDGNWYGYYTDGVPKYFQQWQDGVLVFEHTWYRSGHLRQTLIEGNEYNYNIPSEMTADQELPVEEDTYTLTVETANEQIESMDVNDGLYKAWEDILNQAVRYGLRTICLDCAKSGEERDSRLALAREHFAGRGFRIYELPVSNAGVFLSYICLHIPEQ